MIVDVHVHLAGLGSNASGNWISPTFRRSLAFRQFARRAGITNKMMTVPDADRVIAQRTISLLEKSVVDKAVFLALDKAYREDGTPDDAHTLLATDNDFVADIADSCEKALFGASVHPYRRDAVKELERLAARGAVLVKWLPGAQNIRPDDSRCFAFYNALARLGLPLLCHTGNEHTLKAFPNTLNDPLRLVPALDRGVTVIAAHCGARLFLHERCHLGSWQKLALRYDNFFGDISAFGVVTRAHPLRCLLRSPTLTGRLVYGSDFPATPLPLSCLGWISLKQATTLRRISNPFDRSVGMMKALGVPDSVFACAEKLLRLSPSHTPEKKPAGAVSIA